MANDKQPDLTAAQREALEGFFRAMPLSKADRLISKGKGTIRAAIERGEMDYISIPNSKRMFVTPQAVAEWVTEYCTHRKPAGVAS